jgi:hypothetical protein
MQSAIGPMKSSENLLPPKVIYITCGLTVRQADLDRHHVLALAFAEIEEELTRLREKIRKALKAGAAVEPGTFTARMEWDWAWEDQNKLVIERVPSADD